MDIDDRKKKKEQDDKIRCAQFLLQMIEKYGASVQVEKQKCSVKEA